MRLDELILKMAGDELRLRFHPELTVLSGLAAPERTALAASIVEALAGGGDDVTVRYVDGQGRATTAVSQGGAPMAHHDDDGSPAAPPLPAALAASARSTLVLDADGLGLRPRAPRADEPPELREARASLQELSEELEAAQGEEQQLAGLRSELDDLDVQLRLARDGVARRAYAEVLARLERVRAEMATLESGTTGVEGDRHLLAGAKAASRAAEAWRAAEGRAQELARRIEHGEPLDDAALADLRAIPDDVPADLTPLVDDLLQALWHRDQLDQRLQVLAVATLPAPSQLVVGELGLLDQDALWSSVDTLLEASTALDEVRISVGGLGDEEGGPDPVVIEELEAAHSAVEDAERAAEAVRVSGVAGSGFGVAVAAAGAIGGAPLFALFGLVLASAVAVVTLLLPKSKVAAAAAVERTALDRAGAPSYLGFHLRRVEASVDPVVRERVEGILAQHRRARTAWVELVGPDVDVREIKALEAEIRAYHDALRNLGGAADEIEDLRRQLATTAEPAVAVAWEAVTACCAPLGLDRADLGEAQQVEQRAGERVALGHRARAQLAVADATTASARAAAELDATLQQLGFGTGELDARIGALEWAVIRAAERERARADARPLDVVAADLARLEAEAASRRQPEWSSVTAAEADAPPLEELEERRAKVVAELERARPRVDVSRLADRHAAIERRVSALEARLDQDSGLGDAGAIADVQQHLLAHLTAAAQAGPFGDPVPVVVDEALARVPADRRWDLLDLLLRLAERHQLVYLTDDAFVAAWARQRSADGSITLLEAAPEAV